MNILIIGDWPNYHGGVVNYTRPLAIKLSEIGHEVSYLYSNANLAKSSLFSPKITQELEGEYPFKSFSFLNSKILLRNYDNLSLEHSDWMNNIFKTFLLKINPDIIHINEIFGFSSNIIKVCHELNIPVINTVHEYWFLCPHRVMVDFNKRICEGPSSPQKCAFCISKKLEGFNRNRILTRQIINNYFPSILKYKSLLNFTRQKLLSENENNQSLLDFGNENYKKYCNPKLTNDVTERLKKNIDMLNLSSLIIGVSRDVRNKLIRYGVDEKLIKVQHIGSLIAEKKIRHTKSLNKNKIVFGFIGGVGYYKGVHLIADAFNLLPDDLIKKCEVKIYGKGDENYVEAIKSKLFSNTHKNNFQFFGKYTPADIPEITNQIDISLLPSLCADTAPQTIFESYSAGLPVIGPKIGGFPDFISDGKNGFLFEAADSKSLSEKMLNILKNPHLIDNFKKHIPPLKTLDFNVEELNSIYEELKR